MTTCLYTPQDVGSAKGKPNTGARTLPKTFHKVRTGLAWSHIEDDIVSHVQCFPFLLPSSPGPSSSFFGPSCSPRQRKLLLHSFELLIHNVLLLLFVLMDLLVLEVVRTLLLHSVDLVFFSFLRLRVFSTLLLISLVLFF